MADSNERGVATLDESLKEIETAIASHPEPTPVVYAKAKAAYAAGSARGRTGKSPIPELSEEQFLAMDRFLFAAAFISAWWDVHGDKAKRDEAGKRYALLTTAVGMDPEIALRALMGFEDVHKKVLALELRKSSAKGCGLLPILLLAGTVWAGCALML